MVRGCGVCGGCSCPQGPRDQLITRSQGTGLRARYRLDHFRTRSTEAQRVGAEPAGVSGALHVSSALAKGLVGPGPALGPHAGLPASAVARACAEMT